MTAPTSAKLGVTLLDENQDSAETTVNTFSQLIEAFAGTITFKEMDLNTPPGSPTDGDAYWTGSAATGDWASNQNEIAFYLSGWHFFDISSTGLDISITAFDRNDKQLMTYSPVEDLWFPVQKVWNGTEYWTGKYNSENSKKIYCKCLFDITAPGASATVNQAHGITGLDLDVRVEFEICFYHSTGSAAAFPAPSAQISHTIDATNFTMANSTVIDFGGYRVDVRLEYTK